MDRIEDIDSVIADFSSRKYILEYDKMHAELVTSTFLIILNYYTIW